MQHVKLLERFEGSALVSTHHTLDKSLLWMVRSKGQQNIDYGMPVEANLLVLCVCDIPNRVSLVGLLVGTDHFRDTFPSQRLVDGRASYPIDKLILVQIDYRSIR